MQTETRFPEIAPRGFFSPGEIHYLATDSAMPNILTLLQEGQLQATTFNRKLAAQIGDMQSQTVSEGFVDNYLYSLYELMKLIRDIDQKQIGVLANMGILDPNAVFHEGEPKIARPALEEFNYHEHLGKHAEVALSENEDHAPLPLYYNKKEYAEMDEQLTRSTLLLNAASSPSSLIKDNAINAILFMRKFVDSNMLREDDDAIALRTSIRAVLKLIDREDVRMILKAEPLGHDGP